MNIKSLAAFVSLAVFGGASIAQTVNLPRVNILGKEYYYYEVKKGDSLYGVAKRYDWDPAELLRLNPNTSVTMDKGSRLYYPTGRENINKTETEELSQYAYEPVTHLVRKGESVYSIAHQYGISLETLYAGNPSARYGVKPGEIIQIGQPSPSASEDSQRYLYYNIKDGDDLGVLAEQYDTTVESLMKANPGLTYRRMHPGSVVRVEVGSRERNKTVTTVSEETVESIESYKVKKDDTWDSVSSAAGIGVEQLRAANPDLAKLKKDAVIAVPKIGTIEVEREGAVSDTRELTGEGRKEIYDSIHHIDAAVPLTRVNVAIVLDEPSAKRDIEFTRGVLVALDALKKSGYSISLKVLDGKADEINTIKNLEAYAPQVIFVTADKNFPDYLAQYGNENHIEVVNVFNVKNELYIDNPSMVQIQPPSQYFNDAVVEYITDRYHRRHLLMVGEGDSQDAVGETISHYFESFPTATLSTEALKDYQFEDGQDYLVYCNATKKDEVLDVVSDIELATRAHPGSMITLVGRPSWITLTQPIIEKVVLSDVRIPSRFYYDSESDYAKSFTSGFQNLFDSAPAKSFPMYSATGYDLAMSFIPGFIYNQGDLNRGLPVTNAIQSEIEPVRASNWSGFFNPVCYMLRITSDGKVDKERLK